MSAAAAPVPTVHPIGLRSSILPPLFLLFLGPFPAVLFSQHFPLHFGSHNHRSAFALGIENGLSSFPIFGHRFSAVSPAVPPFMAPSFGFVVHPNFNSIPFRGTLFPSGGSDAGHFATNRFLRDSIFDRDNFQARGCMWEASRAICVDLLGICKGGCEDFSLNGAVLRDCRCVPIGYSAILMGR